MRTRLVPAAVLAALALSACSGGGAPDAGATLPPVAGSPTRSMTAPSATTTAAATLSPAEAQAFAVSFVKDVATAFFEKDPDRIRRLSTPGCNSCAKYIRTAEALRANGTTVDPQYRVEVLDAAAPPVQPAATETTVLVVLRLGPFVVRDASGKEVARQPAEPRLAQNVTLTRVGMRWLVAEVQDA